jgi:hypothetical protein
MSFNTHSSDGHAAANMTAVVYVCLGAIVECIGCSYTDRQLGGPRARRLGSARLSHRSADMDDKIYCQANELV